MKKHDMIKILQWIGGNDTGLSSKAIALHMATGDCDGSYPHDPADLGRCLRLLELFPECKPRISEMAKYGRVWKAYAARWDDMAKSMAEEVGIDWSKGKSAPVTYHLMKEISGE